MQQWYTRCANGKYIRHLLYILADAAENTVVSISPAPQKGAAGKDRRIPLHPPLRNTYWGHPLAARVRPEPEPQTEEVNWLAFVVLRVPLWLGSRFWPIASC